MKFKGLYSQAVANKEDTRRASRIALTGFDMSKLARMGFNEHPYGMSPNVIKAIQDMDVTSNFYGDFFANGLKAELGAMYGLQAHNVLTGSGSSALITTVGTTFLDKDDEVLMCPTFAAFLDMAGIRQAKPVIVPLREDMTYDLDGILEAITEKTKMIVVCNPNNPTGTYIEEQALIDFARKVPDDIVLLFDEAYIEFATATDCKSMYPLIAELPDKPIVVLRTFSKYYGMAGIRIGYALASEEIIAAMAKCPGSAISRSGQAGAIAALKDVDYYEDAKAKVVRDINYLEKELSDMGCTVYHTQTNFIMFDPHVDCQELRMEIIKRGILINTPMLCRVSVGREEENQLFIEQMKGALEKLKKPN